MGTCRRGDALAAAGLDFFMQQVTQVDIALEKFTVGIAKVGNQLSTLEQWALTSVA
jgi:hypothetical protein